MSSTAANPHRLKLDRYKPTGLASYERCPLQFFYNQHSRLNSLWERPNRAFFFGSLVHAVLRDMFRSGGPHQVEWREVDRLYRARWRDVSPTDYGFSDRQQAVDEYREGRHVLQRYYNRFRDHEPEQIEYLRIEDPLQVELDGHTFSGRLDRLDRLPDGSLRIVDYKTGRSAARQDDVAADVQLQAYLLMVREAYHKPAVFVEQVQLRHGQVLRVELDDEVAARKRVLDIVERLEHQDFSPRVNPYCRFCMFRLLCPTWLRGRSEPVAMDELEHVRQSVRLLPLFPPLHVAQGLLERETQGPDSALPSFSRAVVANPGDPVAHFLRGRVLFEGGRARLAYQDLARAIELGVTQLADPNPGLETLYYLGEVSAATGNWQEAVNHATEFIDHFRRLRDSDLGNLLQLDADLVVQAEITRAAAWRTLEQPERARQALEQLLHDSPNNNAAVRALCRVCLDQGELSVAEDLFLRLIELQSNQAADYRLGGQVARLADRWEDAVERYHRAAELDPLDADSWEQLAELAYAVDDFDKAAAAYLTLLELGGWHPEPGAQVQRDMRTSAAVLPNGLVTSCQALLVCQLRMPDPEGAQRTYDWLMDRAAALGDDRAALVTCNTWLSYRPGDGAVLVEKADAALEANQDDEAVDAYTQLSRLLRRDGRLVEAYYMLNRALVLDPDSAGAREEAANLYRARHGKRIAETGDPSKLPEDTTGGMTARIFSGQLIAVVGGDKVGPYYIPRVEELGAECTWISADTNPAYIRDKIHSCAGVCVVTSEIGHALSNETIRQAKLLGIPYVAPSRIRGAERVANTIAVELAPQVVGGR